MADDVTLNEIADLTESYTGADLAGLIRQASLQALKESMTLENQIDSDAVLFVNKGHFMTAIKHFRPSVSAEVHTFFLIIKSHQKDLGICINKFSLFFLFTG